ncbi:MAG: hypothetical protein IKO61_01875 [Lachnospiraceae bacterium]|nr:hypothetical protein [Lachnospiraceae bacterium]
MNNIGKIAETTTIPSEITWNTNSDSLCNYMKEIEFLKSKLKDKAVIPRYVSEDLEYLEIPGLSRIAFPMICFCDIPFSKIRIHIKKYGSYGIAFDKSRILKKYGIQPIHYISNKSPIKYDFKEAYLCSMEIDEQNHKIAPLKDYLLSTVAFMKPVFGLEQCEDGRRDYIFQNENEWRYVPAEKDIPTEMDYVMLNEYVSDNTIKYYSGELEKQKKVWMNFEWEDIKYIIVPNEKDAMEMISYIKELEINEEEKDVLVSKIEVTDRFLEDV